jgi:c-di-GMP-binding flagellar brake protein YcgR
MKEMTVQTASHREGNMAAQCSPTLERRDHFRANVSLPVAYWGEADHVPTKLHAMPVNISGSGMRLSSSHSFAIGDKVSLRIGLPDGNVPALAQVVRVNPERDASQISMQFTAIGTQDQERLVQYIFAQ